MEERVNKRWTSGETRVVPDHVPQHLINSFNFFSEPGMESCPFETIAKIRDARPIFWNVGDQQFGGSWIITRAEEARYVGMHPELFSSRNSAALSQLAGDTWDLIPLELDPPDHTLFRRLLAPKFSVPAIDDLTPAMTARCVRLVDAIRDRSGCEFMTEFGYLFPNGIFTELLGIEDELCPTITGWIEKIMHAGNLDEKSSNARTLRDFIATIIADRQANRGDDLASFIVHAQVDGRALHYDEIMGALYLLFVGAYDTVGATLGFFFRHLAQHPEQQQFLRAHPGQIEKAVEELLRLYSVVSTRRVCARDVEIAGVQMKKGDWVITPLTLASTDPKEFACPHDADFNRTNDRHFAFQVGPHFCMGAHLARRELKIALTEWLARIPLWRLKPGAPPQTHGGVFGVKRLDLIWN